MLFEWNLEPAIFYKEIGSFPLQLRYYSLFFLVGLFSVYHLFKKMCEWEGKSTEDVDNGLVIGVIATVIGARLGHVLFYEPQWLLSNPLKVFQIWQGGLASHGAAIVIPIGLYIYSRQSIDKGFFWVIDRICVCTPLCGALIRIGNFFNSEIYGKPTNENWGVIFKRIDNIPRHPTQIYEAIAYFLMFVVLVLVYRYKKTWIAKKGFLLGLFLVLCFGFRFGIEFFKANQVSFEAGMALNMGQILSIPAVLIGLILIFRR